MNAPDTSRALLRHHVASVEARHALHVIGMLPRGSAAHVTDENALDLLVEAASQGSYIGIAQAEVELTDLIGRPVGIVLTSELPLTSAGDVRSVVSPL